VRSRPSRVRVRRAHGTAVNVVKTSAEDRGTATARSKVRWRLRGAVSLQIDGSGLSKVIKVCGESRLKSCTVLHGVAWNDDIKIEVFSFEETLIR